MSCAIPPAPSRRSGRPVAEVEPPVDIDNRVVWRPPTSPLLWLVGRITTVTPIRSKVALPCQRNRLGSDPCHRVRLLSLRGR